MRRPFAGNQNPTRDLKPGIIRQGVYVPGPDVPGKKAQVKKQNKEQPDGDALGSGFNLS